MLLRRVATHPHAALLLPSHLLDTLLPSRSQWAEKLTHIIQALRRFTSHPSSLDQVLLVITPQNPQLFQSL
jgi:hypothetical protein